MKKMLFPSANRYLKAALALILAVSVMVTTLLAVSATTEDTETTIYQYTQGFELGTGYTVNGRSTGNFKVVDTESYSGDYSLRVRTAATSRNTVVLRDENNELIQYPTGLTSGAVCIASFYYKAADDTTEGSTVTKLSDLAVSKSIAMRFAKAQDNGYNPVLLSSAVSTFGSTTEQGKWKYVETTAFAYDTGTGSASKSTYLAIDFNNGTDSAVVGDIYIDDITFTIIPEGYSYVKLNDYDGNGNYKILTAKTGEAVSLPKLTKQGYAVDIWTDADAVEYSGELTLNGTVTELTANWYRTEYTQGFELGAGYTVTGNRTTDFKVVDTESYSGDYSLRVRTNTNSARHTIVLRDENNELIQYPTELTAGAVCIASFYYKVADDTTENSTVTSFDDVAVSKTLGMRFAKSGASGSNLTLLNSSSFLNFSKNTTKDTWVKKEVAAFAYNTSGNNYLAIDFYNVTGYAVLGDVYIDDITFTIIPEGCSYVKLNDYDGNGNYKILQASTGEVVNLPTPVREGYEFAGWMNGEEAYTASTLTLDGAVTELTAQWTEIKTNVELELKDYNADGSSYVLSGEVGTLVTLPVPTREGYIFTGWKNEDADYYTETTIILDGSITSLTAQWKLIGDLNDDGALTTADTALLREILLAEDTSNADAAANVNQDEAIDICDLVALHLLITSETA